MPRPSRRTCSAQVVVRGNRLSRVTNLGAYTMRPIFVAFLFSFSICAVVQAADAQSSALAVAAGAVRVPMLFTGAVATGPHPPPQCDPGDFARREAAARRDVAKMDADSKSVPALRRRGWPAPGYARCVHCVNARSASAGALRGARRPLPLPNQSDVSPPPLRPASVEQLVRTGRSSPHPVAPLHTRTWSWNQPRRSGGGPQRSQAKTRCLDQDDAVHEAHSSGHGQRLRRGGSSGGSSGCGCACGSV